MKTPGAESVEYVKADGKKLESLKVGKKGLDCSNPKFRSNSASNDSGDGALVC